MKSKKNLLKVLSVVFVVFLLLMTLSSCKKKESEDKLAANPSALVNMNAVAQSGANSGNSIVSVPVPVNGKEMYTTVSEEIVEKPSPSEEVSMSLIKTQNKPEEKEEIVEVSPIPTTEAVVPVPPVFASNLDAVVSNVEVIENKTELETVEMEPSPAASFEPENYEGPSNIKDASDDRGAILSDSYSYAGYNVEFEVYPDKATFRFLQPNPSIQFISALLDKVVEVYPVVYDAVSYSYDGEVLELSYADGFFGSNKEEVYSNLFKLRDLLLSFKESTSKYSKEYQLFGKKVYIEADETGAFITSDQPFSGEEIAYAIEVLKANFPEESKYVTYSLESDGIKLTYPEVDEDYIVVALDELEKLILSYTPMPIAMVEESGIGVETPVVPEETTQEEAKEESEIIKVEPLTTAGKTLSKISLGVTLKSDFDFSDNNPFVFGLEVRGEYQINSRFGAGIKVGYDFAGYIPVMGYIKYNFPNPEGLYVFGEAGLSIGLGDKPTGLILGAGIGYEVELIDNLSIFGEAGVMFKSNSDVKVVPNLTIGAKYSF